MIEEIESISSMRKEAQSRVPPAFAVRQIAVRQATSKFVHHRVIVYLGMPMPVSETSKRSVTRVSVSASRVMLTPTLALLCELHGITEEVEDDLTQPSRTATKQ